MLIRGHFYL